MNDGLAGKVVLITGASRGIGAASARAFAAEGASLGLLARGGARLDDLADELGATALPCDVSNATAVQDAVGRLIARHGQVDVLINNAGVIDPIADLQETDPDAWSRLIDVNVKGVYYGMRAVLPDMRRRKTGTIINLSSSAAHTPLEGWSAYCGSKAAVAMMTRIADLESRSFGVRIMGLAPGTVATEMQAAIRGSGVNRISQMDWDDHGKPEWVGQVLVWMCSPAADSHLGTEVNLRDPEIMSSAGLTG